MLESDITRQIVNDRTERLHRDADASRLGRRGRRRHPRRRRGLLAFMLRG